MESVTLKTPYYLSIPASLNLSHPSQLSLSKPKQAKEGGMDINISIGTRQKGSRKKQRMKRDSFGPDRVMVSGNLEDLGTWAS